MGAASPPNAAEEQAEEEADEEAGAAKVEPALDGHGWLAADAEREEPAQAAHLAWAELGDAGRLEEGLGGRRRQCVDVVACGLCAAAR